MASYVEGALVKDEQIVHVGHISLWSLWHLLPLFGLGLIFLSGGRAAANYFLNNDRNPMHIIRYALAVLLFSSATVMAAPASEDSIKQLLNVVQAQKLLDGTRAQLDSLMNKSIQQGLKGAVPTASQQLAITNMKGRMLALIQGELAWEKLEPLYVRLYQDSFSEEEITGMLAFYDTPAGQAVINKMPVLMQQTMLEMQKMTTGLIPQMQQIQQDFLAEMQAAGK